MIRYRKDICCTPPKMKPTIHVILTAAMFFIVGLIIKLDPTILFMSLVLTLLIDVADHSMIILLIKCRFTDEIKGLLLKKNIKEAYAKYIKERWVIGKAFMHNLAFFMIITAIGIIYKSPVILIGISFHFVCDMMSDFYFMKRLNDNWTFAFLFKKQGKGQRENKERIRQRKNKGKTS